MLRCSGSLTKGCETEEPMYRKLGRLTNCSASVGSPAPQLQRRARCMRLALACIALSAVLLCWAGYVRGQGCTAAQTCGAPMCPFPCHYSANGCNATTGICNCPDPPGNYNFTGTMVSAPQAGLFCQDAASGTCTQSDEANCYIITYYNNTTGMGSPCNNPVCTITVKRNTCRRDQT